MLRIIKQGNRIFAYEINLEDDIDNIEISVEEGDPVLLVGVLEDAEEFGIDPDDIKIVY